MWIEAAGAHLGYCTSIHPGESWAEIRANLDRHTLAVKARVAPARPMGIGLRLGGRAARELAEPAVLEELQAFLRAHALYVFTLNGFPYGSFHRTRVKESVYLPDWLDEERLRYSDLLAGLMAALAGQRWGSVSTVPGAFHARIGGPADRARLAAQLLRHAATLHHLREERGARVALALEPEPACHLETVAQAIAFFEEELWSARGLSLFEQLTGLPPAAGEAFLREHLGLCLDACHLAVQYEPLAETLAAVRRAGLRLVKIQVSAGLELDAEPSALAALEPFVEDVYLHQVTAREGSDLRRFVDLPEAIAALRGGRAAWRVHFHVPIFQPRFGLLRSTQPELERLLEAARRERLSEHLEVETYTWDVLPAAHREVPVEEAIARELGWAEARLRGGEPA
jgi:sugar phosphate isomerase/epimerase